MMMQWSAPLLQGRTLSLDRSIDVAANGMSEVAKSD